MCGISLLISKDSEKIKNIERMTNSISHRGPDSYGYKLFGQLDSYDENIIYENEKKGVSRVPSDVFMAFGHRRLSIVDLTDAGSQPLSDDSGQYWIIFNGEIFNYQFIRSDLERIGYVFKTKTDTEVILNAYKEWGVNCLHKLNGMWAFAIYDIGKKELFLSRDRYGIKPLYYWLSPEGCFAAASEIKQFTCLNGWSAVANNAKIIDFLSIGAMDFDEETMFQGVSQLQPGHYTIIDVSEPRSRNISVIQNKWYEIPNVEKFISEVEAVEKFKELFLDSLKLRSESDVSVGSCLSGGLDSSSVVCAVNELLRDSDSHQNQKTFSMLSDNPDLNEIKWIKSVTEKTHANNFTVVPNAEDCLQLLRNIVWHQDEPFGSLGIYGQHKVFQLAGKEKVKVMLDGQGSDEYLAGYDGFYSAYFNELARSGSLIKLIKEFRESKKFRNYSYFKILKIFGNAILPMQIKEVLKKLLGHKTQSPSWLNIKKYMNSKNRFNQEFGSIRDLSVDQLSKKGIRALLHWEDRNSMAYSIEARVPFLDYRLVEFTLSMPSNMKIRNGITKYLLRESMTGVLPEDVRKRQDKLGFTTDTDKWMTVDKPKQFRGLLVQAIERSSDLISSDVLIEFDRACSERKPVPGHVWRIICFGIWLDVFNVKLAEAA